MKTSIALQLPHPPRNDSLEALLDLIASEADWETVSVAVAYSSVSGVRAFYEIIRSRHPTASFRWLLGLDDYITQPGAIEFCAALPNAELRAYASPDTRSRFHPKLYLLESRVNASMVVGSANLTAAALRRNCEGVAAVRAATNADRARFRASFDSLWRLSKTPTPAEVAEYAAGYRKYRGSRGFVIGWEAPGSGGRGTGEVLLSDAAEVDPSMASVCWIEVGKNTAMGRELEFKAEQALFFGLAPTGGSPEMRNFRVSSGKVIPLRLKFQGNSMWRLQMTRDVPEVDAGLRPLRGGRLERSPFVAVFGRTKGDPTLRLSFPRHDSDKHARIRAASARRGTIGSTSAREYGWY